MNRKIKILNTHYIAVFLFLILSISLYLPVLLAQKIPFGWDELFHMGRVYELVCGLKHGKFFPDISAFSFGERMHGVHLFYPFPALILYAMLCLFFGMFYGKVLGLIVLFFFACLISYFVSYKYFGSKDQALSFALLFNFSMYVLGEQFITATFSRIFARIFLMIAIYGFYSLFFGEEKEWIWATIGIVGVIYSHILTMIMLGICLIAAFLFLIIRKRSLLTFKRLFAMIKTVVVTIILSAIVLFPFLEQSRSACVFSAVKCNLLHYDLFSRLLQTTFSNSLLDVNVNPARPEQGFSLAIFGFFMTVALIVVTYGVIKDCCLTKRGKIFGGLAIIFVILSTNLFPWFLVQEITTFFNQFQYPWRWFVFANLFASLYLSEGIFCLRDCRRFRCLSLFPIILTVNGMVMVMNYLCFPIFQDSHYVSWSNPHYVIIHPHDFLDSETKKAWLSGNFTDYCSIEQSGVSDKSWNLKFPKTIEQKIVVVDGKETQLVFKHNAYVFYVEGLSSNSCKVQLPTTYLKGMKATDEKGNSLSLTRNSKGYPLVKNNGSKTIMIMYHKTFLHKVGIILSGISWIVLGVLAIFSKIKRKRKGINKQ
jgi:hypothetical protein